MDRQIPSDLLPAARYAAMLERFSPAAFGALCPQPPDALDRLLALGLVLSVGTRLCSAGDLTQLVIPQAERAALHAQAARYYLSQLEAGDVAAEPDFVRHLVAQCDLLIRLEPANLAVLLEAMPLAAVQDRAARQQLRYYQGLGEGLADRLGAAQAIFRELLAEPDLDALVRGRVLNSGGLFAQMQGEHQQALDAYSASLAIWRQLGDRRREANSLHNLGILQYELRELEPAEAHARAAAAIYADLGDHYALAMAQNELGLIYRDAGRWQLASETLTKAAAFFEREQAHNSLGIVLGNLGEVALALGQYEHAETQFGRALELMTSSIYAVDYQINLGLIAQVHGDHYAALGAYNAAHTLAEAIGRREILALTHYRAGHTLEQLGEPFLASQRYAAAMDAIEAIRAPLRDQGLLISLMSRWQLVYEAALLLALAQGDLAAAFQISERARARAFADQLARHHTSMPDLAAPIGLDLACATLPAGTLLLTFFATGLPSPEQPLIDAMPPAAESLRACLVTPARLVALALTRAGVQAFPIGLNPAVLQSGVGANDGARFLQPRILARLSAALLEPVAALIQSSTRLVVLPHGPLHQVPFAALTIAGQPLTELVELSYAPSATVLLRVLAERAAAPTQRCLALGYASADGALRHTAAEAERVAARCVGRAWPAGASSIDQLVAEARGCRYLHLACHAEFDFADPLASWLEIGPGLRMRAAEVLERMQISAELVVLSACRSGVSRVVRGDEPIGLARAFLGVGARAVLVTIWPVEDSAARLLMDAFYTCLMRDPSATPASALREAQQILRAMPFETARALLGGEPPNTHALPYVDPFFWAGYALIGAATANMELRA
jgi:tetratricopeptide (TPR) repeat protein